MANTIDPQWAWAPYLPTAEAPWDLKKVGHLYRRLSFGATWRELEAGVQTGLEKTIDALFKGGDSQEQFELESVTAELKESIREANNGRQASAYWLFRMLYSPHPVEEKFTLFWHNHFATSNAKVLNAGFMLRQYDLMHRYCLSSFRAMLREMSTDPAMMVWLDTRLSKKGMPNENYARELMELFSLGIGNYTEKDIREAARAFTGWEIRDQQPFFNSEQHDAGEKTVLGQTGNWKGEDILRICLEQKSAPFFIVRKLFRFLISETIPASQDLLRPLAEQFRKSDFDIGALVRTMVRSNLFFAPAAYRTRVKAPVDFILGIVRALEGRVGTTALAQAMEELGQNLFFPPSVKGWDGGQAWLNGQTILFRQNLALAFTSTEDARFGRRTDPAALVQKYTKDGETDAVEFFLRLFLQDDLPAESRAKLSQYVQKAQKQNYPVYWTQKDAADQRLRALCHLVLTLPEFQLD